MAKLVSIIQNDMSYCIECGAPGTDTHHCVFGSNRMNADRFRLTVRLCRACHRRLHDKDEALAMKYRKMAQKAFEESYSHEEWMKIFGRNYL